VTLVGDCLGHCTTAPALFLPGTVREARYPGPQQRQVTTEIFDDEEVAA
jgi:hypothetical protein